MMRRISLVTGLGLFASFLGSAVLAAPDTSGSIGTDIGQRIPQFSTQAIDLSGPAPKVQDFDSRKNQRLTAYIFVGTRCPASAAYSERFREIEKTYGPKGVEFIYIYPNREDTLETKRAFHKQKQLTGRVIDDQGAKLARLFRAQRTTEIFLVGKEGTVLFHGSLDDNRNDPGAVRQRYLAAAIDEHLAGKPVSVARSQVFA